MSRLFTPARVGPYRLSHRVVMAPLTRLRSESGDRPFRTGAPLAPYDRELFCGGDGRGYTDYDNHRESLRA